VTTRSTERAEQRPSKSLVAGRTRAAGFAAAAVVLAAALVAGCGRSGAQGGAGGPPGGMPPLQVGVVTVKAETLPLTTELPGRVEAARVAQVRARVTGIVQKRLFTEGSDVKAGQKLFLIDPAPYQAAANSARASLAKAQANAKQATALAERYKPLREANAISQQDYLNAEAGAQQAQADVAAAKAALETAELNLGYATVTAPISGHIGRALVTEGALVSQAEATQLALIQQVDPVYVNFTQSVSEVEKLRESLRSGQARSLNGAVPVRIVMEDGTELPQNGKLLFSDLSVDPSTGEISLRAEVPNPGMRLLPGMYVRGRIAQVAVTGAMLVPQQAVSRGTQGDTVMVVGPKNMPTPTPVKLGGAQGDNWVVLGGLKPGDQVIVDGFQKMRPGAPVTPVPWSGAAPAAAGAGSAPAVAAAASR
jgi:membrane fusion protein (multidrug efflux system)